jgi:formylglycine-generating enzyme
MTEPHYIFDTSAELKRLSEMVFVEGGIFRMGGEDDDKDAYDGEKPAHNVTVDSFYIGKYPITQVVWKAVMSHRNPSHFRSDDLPVETVSWGDIQIFINKLNIQTDQKYRVPTEAEWEYVAKGGQYSKDFPFKYSGSNKLNEVGWYTENSHRETKPVGLKSPNFLGIYDMSGNVYEWCFDKRISGQNYNNVIQQSKKHMQTGDLINPTGVSEGTYRIIRGGYWGGNARICRSTNRLSSAQSNRNQTFGFRLVLDFISF